MIELSFNKIKKYLESHLLFEEVSFTVYNNEKVGIVGSNGCGKTTILKMISGIEDMGRYDEGTISLPKGKTIGYLQQIHEYEEEESVREVIQKAFQGVKSLEKEMRELESKMGMAKGAELERAMKRYAELCDAYEAADGYSQDEKMNRVCKGLNIEEEFLNKKFSVLSGGEKTTVALGKILLEMPDILLLDEPTNHLDMDAAEWLEGYINDYQGMVIIVSHDRYFLDKTVNKIIDIEFKRCKTYKGNYSDFVRLKEEELMKQFSDYKDQQNLIRVMKAKIKRYKELGNKNNSPKFFIMASQMQMKLDNMERVARPKFEKDAMRLNISEGDKSGKEVIVGKNLCKAFGERKLLDKAGLFIHRKERVALIGANGSGKTTFLKMLLGEECVDSGELKVGSSVKLAYLPQNIEFEDEDMTAIQCFRDGLDISEGDARGYLAKFFFFGGDPYKKVGKLSGGEKIRLKLARLLYSEINLIILDEPTNHLDIESIKAVEGALKDFGGTIVFISHDRYFINNMSSKIIEFKNSKLNVYMGDYEEYKKAVEKEEALIEERKSKTNPKENKEKKVRNKSQEDIEKSREKIEVKIEMIESEISNIREEMESMGDDYVKLQCLEDEIRNKNDELMNLMERWEVLV